MVFVRRLLVIARQIASLSSSPASASPVIRNYSSTTRKSATQHLFSPRKMDEGSKEVVTVFSEIPCIQDVLEDINLKCGRMCEFISLPVSDDFDEEIAKRLKEAEILLVEPSNFRKLVERNFIPNLKWAQLTWAGVDSLLGLRLPDNLVITRFSGHFFPKLLSEYVIGYIIAHERRMFPMYDVQKNCQEWKIKEFAQYRPLSALSVAVLGLGNIGVRIAEVCSSMGMIVYGMIRTEKEDWKSRYPFLAAKPEIHLTKNLLSCDYVVNVLPQTSETTHLLGGQNVPENVFINIGRGTIIKESELVQCLKEKRIKFAILDVFEKEPLASDHPLWKLENCLITPHVAATSLPEHTAEFFLDNLARKKKGEPLKGLVDMGHEY